MQAKVLPVNCLIPFRKGDDVAHVVGNGEVYGAYTNTSRSLFPTQQQAISCLESLGFRVDLKAWSGGGYSGHTVQASVRRFNIRKAGLSWYLLEDGVAIKASATKAALEAYLYQS